MSPRRNSWAQKPALEGLEPQEQACVLRRPRSLLSVWFLLTFFQPWAPIEARTEKGTLTARVRVSRTSLQSRVSFPLRLSVPRPVSCNVGLSGSRHYRGRGALTWLGATRLGRGPQATSQEMQYMLLGLNQTTVACSEVVRSRPGLPEGTRVASGLVWGRHAWGGPGIESMGPGMLPTPWLTQHQRPTVPGGEAYSSKFLTHGV